MQKVKLALDSSQAWSLINPSLKAAPKSYLRGV